MEGTGEELRWIADEMLGKLARYLRFLGYDVVYALHRKDGDILEQARTEGRTILTRDELLARRGKQRALLLHSPFVEAQLTEVRRAFPQLRTEVEFTRCTSCNGRLQSADRSTPVPPKGVPEHIWMSPDPVMVCSLCGHAYWEGSHTSEIRATFERAFGTHP
ncbi:MAG: Mut7-C RNAse domain-containing protein [Candidatus Thermoplasmatota archaeon]|jgi:uncharacterized protein with PIN domain|nr:Mut7-C RNAse domain-containing protein [Candidatus Thermoplasmatota archaeon]MCL5984247.1 Mut7-C RNAse domain-containing protein [Candidatus Thermoplasmatota archaeon]